MATTTVTEAAAAATDAEPALAFIGQVRLFLWLASGMFSTSSLALAFLDYWAAGSSAQATTHFFAAIVAAGLFGFATLLKLGPDEA